MNKKAVLGLIILLSVTSCVGSQAASTKIVGSTATVTVILTPQPTHILVATSVLANPISPLASESSFSPGFTLYFTVHYIIVIFCKVCLQVNLHHSHF